MPPVIGLGGRDPKIIDGGSSVVEKTDHLRRYGCNPGLCCSENRHLKQRVDEEVDRAGSRVAPRGEESGLRQRASRPRTGRLELPRNNGSRNESEYRHSDIQDEAAIKWQDGPTDTV